MKMLVPEMIQEECTPELLAEKLSAYLSDDESAVKNRHILIQHFTDLHQRFNAMPISKRLKQSLIY